LSRKARFRAIYAAIGVHGTPVFEVLGDEISFFNSLLDKALRANITAARLGLVKLPLRGKNKMGMHRPARRKFLTSLNTRTDKPSVCAE
jgi:hypothetical protein